MKNNKILSICIVGCECVGKTTLIKKLSIFLNEPFAIEYGKFYCKNKIKNGYMKNNKINTTKKDFENIVYMQKKINKKIKEKSKKIFLRDTDFIFTRYFYSKQFNDFAWLDKEIKKQEIDIFFYIQNKNIFPRENTIINLKNFNKENNELLNLYKFFFKKKLFIIESIDTKYIFNKIVDFLTKYGIFKN